jgi:hypothetical protein
MQIRKYAPLILAALIAACGGQEQQQQMAEEAPAMATDGEWQVLFDGSNFDAFRGFQQEGMAPGWEIADGAMVQTDPNSKGDIVTRQQYGDFELRFEWKVPEHGNSGVVYRADEEHRTPWATGPEYQLLDDIGWGEDEPAKNRAGSNYDVYPPAVNVAKPAGEWNTGRIVADGAHIEHWLNGEKVVEYELWTDQWKADVAASKWKDYPDYGTLKRGYISFLGDHSGVSLRNVRIREL